MLKTALRHFPLVLVIVVSFAFVGFALAEETSVDTSADASVQVSTEPSGKPIKPLDLIRAKAGQIKQGAVDAKAQLQANTRMNLQNASSGPEKRDIMKGAVNARIDIAKERKASTTDLRQKMQGVIRQHAGLIKERFSLALRQFAQLTARIESRIEKLKADGVDTASVEADLTLSKAASASAKADIEAVGTFVANVDESADRATVRAELQTLTKKAQASIKAAHDALQKVVRGLVALAKENKPKVETSASVEAEAAASNE